MPTDCSQYGVRMIQEQGGYTPIGCPIGPDCYDIIDVVTGEVIIAKSKGSMPWIPQCGQWGYANPGEAGECPAGQGMINGQCGEFAIACPNGDGTYTLLEATRDASGAVTGLTGRNFGSVPGDQVQMMPRVGARPPGEPWCQPQGQIQEDISPCPGVPEMTYQQWQDQVLQEKLAWEAAGQKTTAGGPVRWSAPDGSKLISQNCFWPDGSSGEVPTNLKDGCPLSCQEIYDQKHPAQEPAPEPTQEPTPAPTPAPKPPPQDEGMVPISIDIQAFTPGGMGPIPAQPLMQAPPLMPPPQAPAPKPAAQVRVPVKPVEDKKLDTGSAIGIGAVILAAAAAAIFGGK
jgi:hypothetical protein